MKGYDETRSAMTNMRDKQKKSSRQKNEIKEKIIKRVKKREKNYTPYYRELSV